MKCLRVRYPFIATCLFVLTMGLSLAAGSDRDQPISIEADRVDVDDAKGVSVYSGNVVLRQGSMELLADTLTLETSAQRELVAVMAQGTPARFKQLNDPTMGEVRGHADKITYEVKDEYLLFVGNAYLWQCGDEVSGNQVEYFGAKALVKAKKAENGQGRVQVVLQPTAQNQVKECAGQGKP